MDLTQEQWLLIQPLLPPQPAAGRRGRPHLDQRQILDGILWKHRTRAPWRAIPSRYGSHQVCYLYFRRWRASGLMKTIFNTLLQDLKTRGNFDVRQAIRDGIVKIERKGVHLLVYIDSQYSETWQVTTGLIYHQWFAQSLEEKMREKL